MFPALAELYRDKRPLVSTFLRGIQGISLFTLPLSCIVIVLSPEIIVGLFGEQWQGSAPILRILACAMFFRIAYTASDAVAKSVGAVYARAWRQWVYAIAVVMGAAIGARWQLEGVAWGILFAIALNFLLSVNLAAKRIDCSWADIGRACGPGLPLAVCTFVITILAAEAFRASQTPAIITALAAASIGAVAFMGALWVLRARLAGANDVFSLFGLGTLR